MSFIKLGCSWRRKLPEKIMILFQPITLTSKMLVMEALGADAVLPLLPRSGPPGLAGTSSLHS
jgi:hypothetical protein